MTPTITPEALEAACAAYYEAGGDTLVYTDRIRAALEAALPELAAPAAAGAPGGRVSVPRWKLERAADIVERDGDEHGIGLDIRQMLSEADQPAAQPQAAGADEVNPNIGTIRRAMAALGAGHELYSLLDHAAAELAVLTVRDQRRAQPQAEKWPEYEDAEALVEYLEGLFDEHEAKPWAPAQAAIRGIRSWQQAEQQGGQEPLWCLHVLGMDEVYPAPSKAHAEKAAAAHNTMFKERAARSGINLEAVVAPWPHDAESHAAGVADFIPAWLLPRWQVESLEASSAAPAAGEAAQSKQQCKSCGPAGVFATDGTGPYDCYACGKKAEQQGAGETVNYAKLYGMLCEAADHAGFNVVMDAEKGVLNLAARQPVGEPVEWQVRGPRTTQWQPCDREFHESAHKADGVETRALYTAPHAAVDLSRVEKALREACEYVGQRSDGDMAALAERCELWMRESRVLIDSMKRQAALIDSKAVRS